MEQLFLWVSNTVTLGEQICYPGSATLLPLVSNPDSTGLNGAVRPAAPRLSPLVFSLSDQQHLVCCRWSSHCQAGSTDSVAAGLLVVRPAPWSLSPRLLTVRPAPWSLSLLVFSLSGQLHGVCRRWSSHSQAGSTESSTESHCLGGNRSISEVYLT